MLIFLAGGSGFLGRALQSTLRDAGHDVRVLSRRASAPHQVAWQPDGTAGAWTEALDGADIIINLAGENLAGGRWTEARKKRLRDSRILSTRSLVAAIQRMSRPPATFLSASGIGYYGPRGDTLVTEDTAPGDDFLAQLCVEWEREAQAAANRTRVVLLRSGVVLHASDGALRQMLLPFKLGLGGRLGSGEQYFPWIHLDDWVGLVVSLATTDAARGAFNVTAPEPVTNAEFTRALGGALHRPTLIPVPALGLKVALGELADTLLTGQRAIPARAQAFGYRFRFPRIDEALRDLL